MRAAARVSSQGGQVRLFDSQLGAGSLLFLCFAAAFASCPSSLEKERHLPAMQNRVARTRWEEKGLYWDKLLGPQSGRRQ